MVNENKIIPDGLPDKNISEPTIMFPVAAPGSTPMPVQKPNDVAVNKGAEDKD